MNLKNLNADFLLDVWADLKEKKLAPVAIGLVLLVVALPAVMLRGGSSPEDAPLPIGVPASDQGGKVEVSEELAERGSKLDSYKSRNPFKGMDVAQDEEQATGSGTATVPGMTGGSAPAGGSGGAPTSGSTGDSAPSTGGSSPPGSTGNAPNIAPPGITTPDTKPEKRFFTFHLDVKFGRPGQERRFRNLPRTSFLPSKRLPVALFMGVSADQRKALFFVYPGLNHQGYGRCIPRPTQCNFVELEVGKDHYFSANDREFHMELIAIKRVRTKDAGSRVTGGGKGDEKQSANRSGRAADDNTLASGDASPEGEAEDDEEYWPFLVDGVE